MTAPQPDSADNAQPQSVKIQVKRRTGVTVFQTSNAWLEWTADDHIRVTDLDIAGSPTNVAFDCEAASLTKVSYVPSTGGGNGQLTFVSGQSKVKIDPDTFMLAPDPWESAAQFDQRAATTPIPSPQWWIERAKAFGADAKTWGFGKIVGITLLAFLAVIIIIAVLVGIFG